MEAVCGKHKNNKYKIYIFLLLAMMEISYGLIDSSVPSCIDRKEIAIQICNDN